MDFTNFWLENAAGGGDSGDPIGQSLRFRGTSGGYLERIVTTAGDSANLTLSCWFKHGQDFDTRFAMSCEPGGSGSQFTGPLVNGNGTLYQYPQPGGGDSSTIVFRDPSAWYHFVWTVDNGKWRYYINGELVFEPTTNSNTFFNAGRRIEIGSQDNGQGRKNQYLAQMYCIDGQALEPTDFGRYNTAGVWVPVDYSGTYGTNGFRLDFSDPNDLGADRSGNGNDFTATGFVTAKAANYEFTSSSSTPNSFPSTSGGFNAPFELPSSYVYLGSTTGTFTWNFNSPIVANNSIGIYWQGTSAYGNNSLTITYADTTTTTHAFDDPGIDTQIPNLVSVNTTGGEIVKLELSNTGGSLGGFAGLEIDGSKLLLEGDGSDYDWMQDSPTQNYATLNPLFASTAATYFNANLGANVPTTGGNKTINTIASPDTRIYFEVNLNSPKSNASYPLIAVQKIGTNGDVNSAFYIQSDSGQVFLMDVDAGYQSQTYAGLPTWQVNDIIKITWDPTTSTVGCGVNDGAIVELTTTTDFSDVGLHWGITSVSASPNTTINFGQQPFRYTPPAGFEAFQTQNLPAPTIADGSDHFQAITGPGTGANAAAGTIIGAFSTTWSASGDGFGSQPPANAFSSDTTAALNNNASSQVVTWDTSSFNLVGELSINMRGSGYRLLIDGVEAVVLTTPDGQGDNKDYTFTVNNPQSLVWDPNPNGGNGIYIYNFSLDGDDLRDGNILAIAQQTFPYGLWWIKDRVNSNQHQLVDSVRGGNLAFTCPAKGPESTYVAPSGDSVAWCWGTDDTGTNADAGFQILTWTGTGSARTISHDLDQSRPLDMILVKMHSAESGNTYVDAANILFWHKEMPDNGFAYFNLPNQFGTTDSFFNGNPNASLGNLTLGSDPDTNADPVAYGAPSNYVGYVWQSVPGYSAFGIYSGNSDADGPFVYTGFRPAMVMVKATNTANNWIIRDSTRSPHNPVETYNYITTASEATGRQIDFLSNGFKPRHSGAVDNTSGTNFIYCAWAENPFSSPATAR